MQNLVPATSHFFDQHKAKLFLDSGKVISVGDPSRITPANAEHVIESLERVLKRRGVIGSQDSLVWVQ